MSDGASHLAVYLHLAKASQSRRRPLVRDKLLVLAGALAAEQALSPIAAICREQILAHNPQHLVREWPTIEAALAEERFTTYLKQLRRRYSPERAEHLLHSLGIELGRERELYENEAEYAAALLGMGIAPTVKSSRPAPPDRMVLDDKLTSRASDASSISGRFWLVLLGAVALIGAIVAWSLWAL